MAEDTKTILLRGGPKDGWVYKRPTYMLPKRAGVHYISDLIYEPTGEIEDGHEVYVFIRDDLAPRPAHE